MSKESVIKWLKDAKEKRDNRLNELLGVPLKAQIPSQKLTQALTGEFGEEARGLAEMPTIYVLPNTPTLPGPKRFTWDQIETEIAQQSKIGKKFQKAIENHLRRLDV